MLVFDRILDGDDVPLVALVDRGDQRRQRGGLARSRRSADQHEAARQRGEQADVVGEVQLGEPRNPQRQRADRRGGAAALAVQVHPEAAKPRPRERQIDRVAGAVALQQARRDGRADGVLDLLAAERLGGDAKQPAGCTHDRRRSGHEEQIAAAVLVAHALQPRVEPREIRVDERPLVGTA